MTTDPSSSARYAELAAINAELAAAGYQDIQYLANHKTKYSPAQYRRAAEILLSWIERVQTHTGRHLVISGLRTRSARPLACKALVQLFETVQPDDGWYLCKWEIGDAINYVADACIADDIIRIALDTCHGRSRDMVVDAVGKLKDPRVCDVLIPLLDDEDVFTGALAGISRVSCPGAIPRLMEVFKLKNGWAWTKARQALRRAGAVGYETSC